MRTDPEIEVAKKPDHHDLSTFLEIERVEIDEHHEPSVAQHHLAGTIPYRALATVVAQDNQTVLP